MIRVMVVDDHALVRAGLLQLIAGASDLEVVAQASDGQEALDRYEAMPAEARPDVVLMDLSMPRMEGIEVTRRLLGIDPGACVVGLTSFSDQSRVLAMLDAGAIGYLVKDAAPREILDGIRAAANGDAPLSLVAATAVVRSRSSRGSSPTLTARERDVLQLLSKGMSNQAIGSRLGISEATVKAHLTRVYQTIGVSDRTTAALRALQLGIVGDD
jgi:DNA-binding NarL/FixJ family response regulator